MRLLPATVLALCALGLCPFSVCLGAQAAQPEAAIRLSAEQQRAAGIETAPLAAGTGMLPGLPAQVVVPNEQLRVVAAPLPGLVTQLLVAPGETVRQGQPLARLASPALLQAGREYLDAAQLAQLAQRQAARDSALADEGIIAAARAEASLVAQRQAAAALAEKREALRLAGIAPASLQAPGARLPSEIAIAAPIDGVVLEQHAAPGQRVDAAAPLFRIGRLQPLWLEIQVPAALAAQLREGSAVEVAGSAAAGRVINIGRAVAGGSQTLQLRARIDRGAEHLVPGQMVEAMLQQPADGAFLVPQAAVVRHQGRAWIFVAAGDAFRPLAVTPQGQAGDRVLLRGAGLEPGLRLAVRGTAALKAAWLGIGREE